MTELDAFDLKLAEALMRYASEAPTDLDPAAIARSVGAIRTRRPAAHGPRFAATPLARAGLVALLVLATFLVAIAAGALIRRMTPAELPIPDRLSGRFQASLKATDAAIPGTYVLQLNGSALLVDPSGSPVPWAGRAVGLDAGPRVGELVVASDACGEGRYRIVGGGLDQDQQSLTLADPRDACPERVAILTAGQWSRPSHEDLASGVRYDSLDFTEPFTFTNPAWDPAAPPADERHWGWGGLRIANRYSWSSSFHDDQPVSVDVCNPRGETLGDIPATPEAVGEWLQSGSAIDVAPAIPIQVDGRTALRYDVMLADRCRTFNAALAPPQFSLSFRVYAIPTGDDTIIYVLWSDAGSYAGVEASADQLVRSIEFR